EAMTVFSPETRERVIALVRRLGGLYVDRVAALHAAVTAPLRQQAIALLDRLVPRDALIRAYSETFLRAGLALAVCA
ncbi:hypothetical protein ABTO06_19450, partial [Acinetobacter baumannii]